MCGQGVAIKLHPKRKPMAAATPDEIGRRVAELYQELSFPAPAKLQSALRKEGISLSLSALKELTSESGARQVFQPPPRYGGNITSGRMDDRWAADLLSFESRPAKRAEATHLHGCAVRTGHLQPLPLGRANQQQNTGATSL